LDGLFRLVCVNFFSRYLKLLALCLSAAAGIVLTAPAMAASPEATKLTSPVFVLNSQDANISIIDPKTWLEIKRVPTGKEPHHLYLTPDEKSFIVANAFGDSLTFIDPKTGDIQRTLRGILDPYHLRFSSDMKWFVTAANRLNHVDVYRWDGKELFLAKRIATSKTPSHLWIDSKSSTVYATMQDSDEVIAIDLPTQTIKWRTKTGTMPADVYVTADDKTLLVGLTGSDGVQVFDLSGDTSKPPRQVKIIKTGKGAHAFRSAGDKQHVFVSNRVANSISKIDLQTLTVVENYNVPGGPDCMDVSADGKLLLVTARWIKKLTVIDLETKKITHQVNVGRSPHGVWTLDHAPR
jgi:DNA-binding beta-propeller fold protein YncE